jgi:hypothetical protein
VIRSRRFAAAALSGTIVLAALVVGTRLDIGSPRPGMTEAPPPAAAAASVIAEAPSSEAAPAAPADNPTPTADAAIADAVTGDAAIGDPASAVPVSLPETPPAQAASAGTPESMRDDAKETVSAAAAATDCLEAQACIDRYLMSLYERTPKLDTIKVPEQVKVTVKKNGKTKTVTKTVQKLVDEDFGWKDPKAAQKYGMSLQDYVFGGMDRSFKLRLYRALRAMDDAGLEPGITSAFRDDYRQSLASGLKAATDRSFHGGSFRGGYGHGLAADLVSVKGDTRAQRWVSSEDLWKWVDAHGKEFGIARPYLGRDPPHVGPIDGEEYAMKRGRAKEKVARSETNKHNVSAVSDNHAKSAKTASPKAKSI